MDMAGDNAQRQTFQSVNHFSLCLHLLYSLVLCQHFRDCRCNDSRITSPLLYIQFLTRLCFGEVLFPISSAFKNGVAHLYSRCCERGVPAAAVHPRDDRNVRSRRAHPAERVGAKRTNNRVEGWHSRLDKAIAAPHPNTHKLASLCLSPRHPVASSLKLEQAATEMSVLQAR